MGQIANTQNSLPTPTERYYVLYPCDTAELQPRAAPTQLQEVALPTTSLSSSHIWGAPPVMTDSSFVDGFDVESIQRRFRKLYLRVGRYSMTSFWQFTSGDFNYVGATAFFNERVQPILKNALAQARLSQRSTFPTELGNHASVKDDWFVFIVDVEEFSQDINVSYEENAFSHLVNWGSSKMRALTAYSPGEKKVEGDLLDRLGLTVQNWFVSLKDWAQKSHSWIKNALSGGRVELPYVWESTAYDSTSKFAIHLYARQPSLEYVWSDIVVPLALLISLTAPVPLGSGVAFITPPQVRVEVPGLFYMPVGYVNSLSLSIPEVTTDEGLPLVVNVVITLKSLFSTLIRDSGTKEKFSATGSPTGAPLVSELLSPLLMTEPGVHGGKYIPVSNMEKSSEVEITPSTQQQQQGSPPSG
jgi:hypothetical protein